MKKKELKKRVQELERQLNHLASLVMRSSEKVTDDLAEIRESQRQISREFRVRITNLELQNWPVKNPDISNTK